MFKGGIAKVVVDRHFHTSRIAKAHIVHDRLNRQNGKIQGDHSGKTLKRPLRDKVIEEIPVEQRVQGVDHADQQSEGHHPEHLRLVRFQKRKDLRKTEERQNRGFFFIPVHRPSSFPAVCRS